MAFYFRANYSSLMKPCLVLKRPQTCTMNHSHTWSPHYQDTFFTSYPGWWRNWWHNSMQTHKKPSEFSKVWKRKSGRKTERGREVPDRWRVADAADIFSCQIFIFHTNVFFFFFQRIWKHGLAIERLGKGFRFIMHWNYFLMVQEKQAILLL